MISYLFGSALALLALLCLALLKTYRHMPAKELKRLARHGDHLAELLYKPVAYGASLAALLWLLIGLSTAGSVVLFAGVLPAWLAVIVVALIIWVGFVWIPSGDLSRTGVWFARSSAPVFAWLLERLHPLLSYIQRVVRHYRPVTIHTGLYEKEDVIELLERQKHQPDNRIKPGEIELLVHALSFGDKLVSEVLVPKRVVTFVNASDSIGPVLTDELHKSGHSRFPVFEGKRDNLVGILYLKDLIMTHKTGSVRDLMQPHLSYVHEDFTLYQTLQAFLKTKHHLFLVVNNFEEFVGIITIEDIVEQMVGKPIVDEFDKYDDLRAVAAAAAKKDHADHEKDKTEPKPEPEQAKPEASD
ncbi:MAG: CBS domain-containing protein [Candidatus Saccharimonadales bacterium]